jgi:2-phospho-L-lactate guanylyltransferase
MHILIPCKGLSAGKSRLRSCLPAREHRAFCEHLVTSTLDTAVKVAGAGNVSILTSDDDAASIAWRYRVGRIADQGLGLNAGLEFARNSLLAHLADSAEVLVLPTDLPFARPEALEDMADGKDDLVIAPDERESGTNVLLMRPDALRRISFAYGDASFAAHIRAAKTFNLSIRVVRRRALAFDIDEPAQYFRWVQSCEQNGRPYCGGETSPPTSG